MAEVQGAIDRANEGVSRAESVRKFAILADHWTEGGGLLTPTMKLKRQVVVNDFRDDIERLYTGPR